MKIVRGLLFWAMSLLLLVGNLRAGENLLPNPGFEAGKDTQATGWSSSSWKTQTAVHQRTEAQKHTGKFSFYLRLNGAGGVQLISSEITLATENVRSLSLTLSGYYFGNKRRASSQIRYFRIGDNGKSIPIINGLGRQMRARLVLKPTMKWTAFTQIISIPKRILREARPFRVALYFFAAQNDEIYLDDLQLVSQAVAGQMNSVTAAANPEGDFRNLVIQQPEISAQEKSWYGPFPKLSSTIEYKNGIAYRNGKPYFLFGTQTLAGSQWSAASNWIPRVLKHDYVDLANSFSRSMTTRIDKDKRLHIEWKDVSWSYSLARELARMGIHTWYDVGTSKYRYNGSLIKYEGRYPEIKKIFRRGSHFYPFDHNNPTGRAFYKAMWQSYTRYFPGKPSFIGFEVFNELGYQPDFPATILAFGKYALQKYGSLAEANRVWRTEFKTISTIKPPQLWDDSLSDFEKVFYRKQQSTRYWEMYHDWQAFLRVYFMKGFRELKKMQRTITNAPFTLDCRYEQTSGDAYTNIDPEQIAEVADILAAHVTGFRFYNYNLKPADPTSVLNSLTRPFMYLDYLRTAVQKPIINSETIFRYAIQPGSQEQYMIENSLVKLHKDWEFRTDPENVGVAEGWFRDDLNTKKWGTMKVPGLWEDNDKTYADYDGIAWYRTEFIMPKWCKASFEDGTRRYLLAGKGLDDSGSLYLNGKKIGEFRGWKKKYTIDVSEFLRYGKKNTLAVRINDTGLGGGIRFYLTLISDNMFSQRKELNRAQLSALFWSNAVHGTSGLTAWYWDDPMQTWIPELRSSINSVAEVLLPRPRIKGKVGLFFSWETFRGFFTATNSRSEDIMEYIGALTFTQMPFDILSNRVFLKMKNDRYDLIVAPYARIVKDGSFAKLKSYVETGGTAVLTYDSFSVSDKRYADLNVQALAGVTFGQSFVGKDSVSYKGKTFSVTPGKYTKKSGIRLTNVSAEVLATYQDGSPAITSRSIGDGRIYFIAAELDLQSIRQLLSDIMKARTIQSPVQITSKNQQEFPYIEAQLIGNQKRFLLYLVNWGGQPHPLTVQLFAPYTNAGEYTVRDVQNTEWAGNNKVMSAQKLSAGFSLTVPVQMPTVLLFESTKQKKRLKLRHISPARKSMLARIEAMKKNPLPSTRPKALFLADPQNGNRHTLLGKVVHPLAVQLLRREGYDVYCVDFRTLTAENIKKYALMIIVDDSKLKVYQIQRDVKFIGIVKAYVKNGGNLLLAGSGSVHYNANNRLIEKLVTEPFKIRARGFCKNPQSSGYGDPLQLKVKTFAPHPLTAYVKELQFFVCAALSGTADGFTPVAFTEKTDLSYPSTPLVFAAEIGTGRMVVVAENTWMQPFRIEAADNAQFFMNIIHWLGRKPVEKYDKKTLLDSLFITEARLRKIEREEALP